MARPAKSRPKPQTKLSYHPAGAPLLEQNEMVGEGLRASLPVVPTAQRLRTHWLAPILFPRLVPLLQASCHPAGKGPASPGGPELFCGLQLMFPRQVGSPSLPSVVVPSLPAINGLAFRNCPLLTCTTNGSWDGQALNQLIQSMCKVRVCRI